MRQLFIFAIDIYRAAARPFLPPACRFHPSCGDYAAKSVRVHGAFRGLLLAALRLARCHPFNAGGFDPVPGRGQTRSFAVASELRPALQLRNCGSDPYTRS